MCGNSARTAVFPPHMAPMPCRVRHEAGEALGAIGMTSCVEPLKAHQDDASLEVRSATTCCRVHLHNDTTLDAVPGQCSG